MPQPPIIRPSEDPPRFSRMPHISAPVDEHPLVPTPPRSLWDRLLLVALGLGVAAAVLAYFFTHATALR